MEVKCAHTKLVPIESIVGHPRNPNKHSQAQIKLLAKIMKHQGWRHPITISKRSGFIVAGHGRLQAAILNGWETCPIDEQDFANEADEYAHMVADNKIAELAELDLLMVSEDVIKFGKDFDFDTLGIPDFKSQDAIIPMPDLPSGEKSPLCQMTFILSNEQSEKVKQAIDVAKSMGPIEDELNQNSNGNALARVCELFTGQNGEG